MNYFVVARLTAPPADRVHELRIGLAIVACDDAVKAGWAMEFMRAVELEILPLAHGMTDITFEWMDAHVGKIRSVAVCDGASIDARGVIDAQSVTDPRPPCTGHVLLAFKSVGGASATEVQHTLARLRELAGCNELAVLSAAQPELLLRAIS